MTAVFTQAAARLSSLRLTSLDEHLINQGARPGLDGVARAATEFAYFGLKQARACLFAGLFFAAVFSLPRGGLLGIPRYDLLFVWAIAIQAWMVWAKLETVGRVEGDHACSTLIGFALEVFKTSGGVQAWSYPDFGYAKLLGVPLFSGFMYAAVGSYIIQAWRLFDLRIVQPPALLDGRPVGAADLRELLHEPFHRRLPLVHRGMCHRAVCAVRGDLQAARPGSTDAAACRPSCSSASSSGWPRT